MPSSYTSPSGLGLVEIDHCPHEIMSALLHREKENPANLWKYPFMESAAE